MQFAYDDFGQLVTEYQEHGGAVNTSTSLKVGYSYADGSSNTIRPTKMTYPDARELNYGYGSSGSTDDALSRAASLIDNDGTTHLVDYSYLGAGAFTETDFAAIDVKHTLVGTAGGNDPDTGDIYRGLDRFGRVKDCYWYDYGSSAGVLRIKHGHDRAGNRLYREEADTSDLDQLYSYDDVNRLTQSQEGTLSVSKDSISSLNFAQQWSLDATGNWSGFKEDNDGDSTWDLNQLRTSNKVNEIADVAETSGPAWVTPAYNRAGNMTTIPKPADPTSSFGATYDAWNRLVKLVDDANTVAEYFYDGAKRLVARKKYVSGSLNQTRHFYYTSQWQTIEERIESGGQIASTADRQFTWGQRHIDDLVCRTANSSHDYAYQDANWNVILSSSALSRVGYQPYGQIRSTCAAAQGSLDTWQYYFAGYRRDEDTGLYLVGHRVYQPEMGCWVQRDPTGYLDSFNVYAYAQNHPLNLYDPLGLWVNNQCTFDCENDCYDEYDSWWQWPQFAGCVQGCNLGCQGKGFTFCNYVNNWDECYDLGLQCVCGIAAIPDAFTLPPVVEQIVGGADCACAVVTAIQESCEGNAGSNTSIGVAVADCGMDLVNVKDPYINFWIEVLIESANEAAVVSGGGISSPEACVDWNCKC